MKTKFLSLFVFSFLIIFIIALIILSDENIGESVLKKGNFKNLPINNYILTSDYGKRISPISGRIIMHNGVDLAAKEGEPLFSIIDGKVIKCSFFGMYGYCIIVSNKNVECLYAHVSNNFIVREGMNVKRGEIIGMVGPKYINYPRRYFDGKGFTNGLTTGSHLHFGIKINGAYINPRSIINIS